MKIVWSLALFIVMLNFSACRHVMQTAEPQLLEDSYRSYDGTEFPLHKWGKSDTPKLVVIAVHGIAGASRDFRNLATALEEVQPEIKLIAYNVRGQGLDPREDERGDINHPTEWYQDLSDFTDLVRKQHPQSKIVWAGESMGALIVTHGFSANPDKCDALILASPIVAIKEKVNPVKKLTVRVLAFIFPKLKISLETLSGQENAKVSGETIHKEQAQKNPWHLERFTIRLLHTLGRMIEQIDTISQDITVPILVLSAGKDVFIEADDVAHFVAGLPDSAEVTHRHYNDSYHLLFYDQGRERVIRDTIDWLASQLKD